jgi:acetoacetyl-CoA synthetase
MPNKILWEPSSYNLQESQMALVAKELGFVSYQELYKWSIKDPYAFWKYWLVKSGIDFSGSVENIFTPSSNKTMYGGQWFPDVKLNYAKNLLKNLSQTPIIGHSENLNPKIFTREDVWEAVRKIQSYFIEKGICAGDVVAALAPNNPETLLCMLAATSIGAVWSSCSPEFGVKAVIDRFEQIHPKLLITCESYFYNSKLVECSEKIEQLLEKLPSIKNHLHISHQKNSEFQLLLNSDRSHQLEFNKFPFSHPLFILFSSGTTGAPKCIIHSAGGTLIQHTKEHLLHCDLKKDEDFFYYTTTGWMMWNWMASSLFAGVKLHTYNGAPFTHENKWSLWDFVHQNKIKIFGTSARFIGSCRQSKESLANKISSLRLVLSTGSPLLPDDFDYFYSECSTSSSVQLSSISGGTDIISCFMLGNPLLPVRRSEIQAPGLAMDVKAYNLNGEAVFSEEAELVCQQVFPSMPLGFANDTDHEKYNKAYFSRFPGVWHHGDFVTIYSYGGIIIHGRSDTTLNPGGVRIGSSEIYQVVESHPSVQDSLVVGKIINEDEKIILFVVLKNSLKLDEVIRKEINQRLRQEASPRHVPYRIFQVTEIPYTLSGKKVEVAVKQILAGQKPQNIEALANPNCLKEFQMVPPDFW